MPPPPVSREALLQLYKQLLRSCQTYPSKNRAGMYQAIREEWRDHKDQADETKLNQQITIAYKGLSQLRQFGTFVAGLCTFAKQKKNQAPPPHTTLFAPVIFCRCGKHDQRKGAFRKLGCPIR